MLSGGLVLPVGTSVVVICGELDLPEGASVVRAVAGYWAGFRAEGADLSVRVDFLTCSGRGRCSGGIPEGFRVGAVRVHRQQGYPYSRGPDISIWISFLATFGFRF